MTIQLLTLSDDKITMCGQS